MNISFQWTTGESAASQQFYAITEAYYTSIVGGIGERLAFVPYNASAQIPHVVLALKDAGPWAALGSSHTPRRMER